MIDAIFLDGNIRKKVIQP